VNARTGPAVTDGLPTRAIVLTVVVVAVAVFLVTVPTFRHFFDLGVYRGAVQHWLIDGGDLYDYRYQGTGYGFTYPPFAALMLSPLAATSWPVAVAVGLAVNTVAVGLLLRWFLVPVARRHGWDPVTAVGLAFCAIVVFEPVRDTFSFGQVNLILLILVLADLRAMRRGRTTDGGRTDNRGRWAGIGIGLAAAIKLTPAIFIVYLLVARRYRAAAVATGTGAVATVLTALVAPGTSRVFWAGALWDTDRIGDLAYVSNQSLRGVVARLDADAVWWLAAVAVVLAVWSWRCRVAAATRDDVAGFALTGIVGCLISPVTWVHHLVWLLPALFLLFGGAVAEPDPRRRLWRLTGVAAVHVVLSSSVVWLWWAGVHGWAGTLGSNTYVWISVVLLLTVPIGGLAPPHVVDRFSAGHGRVAG
jgi:alpha-1,2-mannosyltransferase